MEIISGSSNLSNIKTAVFYKWNKYLPENAGSLSRCHDIFLKDYSSTDVFYLSDTSQTEYLDFSEYDFKIKPEKGKYGSFIKTNYFDSFTKETFIKKEDGCLDETALNWLTKFMFPQYSEESGPLEKRFFGMITNGSQGVIYLDIPGEERNPNNPNELLTNGVWKIELYSDYLNTNNSLGGDFIEYSVLNSCGVDNIIKPVLTVIFGPSSVAKQNPKEMYYDSSDLLGEFPVYSGEKETARNWSELCREISSRKILYLIISSSGALSSINLSYLSWELSKDPNRNQNEYSLRNDSFWATRDIASSISKEDSGFIYDSVSGILLSTKKLYPGDTPIIDKRMGKLPNKFLSRKVYSESEIIPLNDNLYVSLVSGNLGENPIYSKYWMKLKDYEFGDESEYLGLSRYDSLKVLKKALDPDYTSFFIHTNDKSLSEIYPQGDLLYRLGKSREITIKPLPGYDISEIYENGERSSWNKNENYDINRSLYTYTISSTEENVKTVQDIFIEVVKSGYFIDFKSPLKIWDFGKTKYTELDYNNLSSLVDISILSKLYCESSGTEIFPGLAPDSITPTRMYNITEIQENDSIYLELDFENSEYESYSVSVKSSDSAEFIECLKTSDDIYKSKYKIYPISENDKVSSREVSIELITKRLEVIVETSDHIDSSCFGDYIAYDGSFSFKFTPTSDLIEFSKITWKFEGDEESKEMFQPGNYSSSNGIEAQLFNDMGIYTFRLFNIRKNCKIKILES